MYSELRSKSPFLFALGVSIDEKLFYKARIIEHNGKNNSLRGTEWVIVLVQRCLRLFRDIDRRAGL